MIVVEKKSLVRSRLFAVGAALLLVSTLGIVISTKLFALPALSVTSCADFATYFPDDTTNADADITIENDIDCTGITFEPLFIGGAFTGTFNGGGHTISNLTIVGTPSSSAAMFHETDGATFSNITFHTVTITAQSNEYTGVLVGYGEGAVIDNVHVVNGDVTGLGGEVGGIIGYVDAWDSNDVAVRDSSYEGTLNGQDGVGGLIGGAYVGPGYSGEFTGNDTSGARFEVDNGNDANYIGGLMGDIFCQGSPITFANNATYAPDIEPLVAPHGGSAGYVGGLVGAVDCYAGFESYGNTVTGTRVSGTDRIGGMYGEIEISGSGEGSAWFHDEHVTVDVYALVDEYGGQAGGYASYLSVYDDDITNGSSVRLSKLSASGDVSGLDNSGGLLGAIYVDGANCSTVPAMLLIEQSYAAGDLTILEDLGWSAAGYSGGFIGYGGTECATISQSYSEGDVYIDPDSDNRSLDIGAFMGYSGLHIEDSYARGAVLLSQPEGDYYQTPDIVGGFIGFASDELTLTNIYATGEVYQTYNNYGGIYGCDNYDIPGTGVYWDVDTSGVALADGTGCNPQSPGVGLTTTAMKTQSSFVEYDFTNVWLMNPSANDGYPCLRFSQECLSDVDGDGISNDIENAGPNNGDGNDDGIRDSDQPNVSTVYDPTTEKHVTVVVDDDATIDDVTVTDESENPTQDPDSDYPGGLVDTSITPANPGDSVDVEIIYNDIDPSDPVVKTYDEDTELYNEESEPEYTYTPGVIDGDPTGTVEFTATDGDTTDTDGSSNGTITTEQIGVGDTPSSGSGSGGSGGSTGGSGGGGQSGTDAENLPGTPNTGMQAIRPYGFVLSALIGAAGAATFGWLIVRRVQAAHKSV